MEPHFLSQLSGDYFEIYSENKFSCFYCDQKFLDFFDLQDHFQTHLNGVATAEPENDEMANKNKTTSPVDEESWPFQCNYCDKRLQTCELLRKHINNVHHSKREFNCTKCGKHFRELETLRKHEDCHESSRPFQCTFCKKGFSRQQHLKSHIRTHTHDRPYQCKYCPKSFSWKSNLQAHIRRHERLYKCSLCDRTFDHELNMKNHELCHMGSNNFAITAIQPAVVKDKTLFSCNKCSQSFSTVDYLQRHKCTEAEASEQETDTSENGRNETPVKVETNANFDSNADVSTPVSVITAVNETKTIATAHVLKIPLTKETIATPLHLPKAFDASFLRQSLQKTKACASNTTFKCTYCSKTFITNRLLLDHQTMHTGEKPYPCKMCGKHFRQAQLLKSHVFRSHSGVKPFKCDHCARAFNDLSNMKRHVARCPFRPQVA